MTNADTNAAGSATITIDEVCTVVSTCLAAADSTPVTIEPDTELLLTGMLDSLTIVKIVTEIERKLDISVPETVVVARNFRTPTTLHAAITDVVENAS